MTEKARIYVPDDKERSNEVIEKTVRRLSLEYGGATVIPDNEGYWYNGERELIQDSITMIETVGDIDESQIRELCSFIRMALNEDSVMYEITETNVGYVSD